MSRLRMAVMAGASLVAAVSAAGAQMRVASPMPAAMAPPAGLQTSQGRGGFDPRRLPRNDPRVDDRDRRSGGGWWERTGRDRGEWDRMSDKERRKAQREYEKDQRKRNKEWEKRQKSRGHDDSDSDSDDDDDNDRGNRRRGDARRDGRIDGRYDPRNRTGGWPGRVGVPTSGTCIDRNRDGVCDPRP